MSRVSQCIYLTSLETQARSITEANRTAQNRTGQIRTVKANRQIEVHWAEQHQTEFE